MINSNMIQVKVLARSITMRKIKTKSCGQVMIISNHILDKVQLLPIMDQNRASPKIPRKIRKIKNFGVKTAKQNLPLKIFSLIIKKINQG